MPEISLKRSLSRMGIAIFLFYLSVALPLPVVSVFAVKELGLANWLGGLAVGISFLSTILSRKYAGYFADVVSGKKCTVIGLLLYMGAAAICAAASLRGLSAGTAYAVLIAGRLVLGFGESMALLGLLTWHFSLIGHRHSGKIISVGGMAMYGAFAAGGPLGFLIYKNSGFAALMAASFLFPVIGYAMLYGLRDVLVQSSVDKREPFMLTIGRIWKLGTVVSLQGVGFAVLGAFIPLYFLSKGWPYAGFCLTGFGAGFVFNRIAFGHLPDKIGGVLIAVVSLAVETAGQCLLWLAPGVVFALAGALLTGLGCSMVYPAMGVEVIRRIPPELRGTGFGGFAAFQDVAYAFSGLIAGLLADHFGFSVVFLFGAAAAFTGIIMTLTIRKPAKLS